MKEPFVTVTLLSVFLPPVVHAADYPNTVGIVLGSIFGTLAVVFIVLAIIYFCCIRKRKARDIVTPPSPGKQGHTNPSFEPDVESASVKPVIDESKHKENGFGGYVVCREYESKVKFVTPKDSSSSAKSKGKQALIFPLQRGNSIGSLDNGMPSSNSEVVEVVLQSQDIVGLGFNIAGSMRDGIFVSQVLNRGPASESGLVEAGDRILSVTISFENMVYEDALTILSYASPYPVKLHLQKPVSTSPIPSETADSSSLEILNHPVLSNRSQSLDDLRLISRENITHPLRSYSVMKRVKRDDDDDNDLRDAGQLRKWAGKHDMMTDDFSDTGELQTQSSTSNWSLSDLKTGIVNSAECSKNSLQSKYKETKEVHKVEVHKSQLVEELPDLPKDSDFRSTGKNLSMAEAYRDLSEADQQDVIRLTYEDSSRNIGVKGFENGDDLDVPIYHDSPRVQRLLLPSDRQLATGSPSSLDIDIPLNRNGQFDASETSDIRKAREVTDGTVSESSLDGIRSLDVDIPLNVDTHALSPSPTMVVEETIVKTHRARDKIAPPMLAVNSLNQEKETGASSSSPSSLASSSPDVHIVHQNGSDKFTGDINENKIFLDRNEVVRTVSYHNEAGCPPDHSPPPPPESNSFGFISANGTLNDGGIQTNLMKDDSNISLEDISQQGEQTEEESNTILKEYFGDKPSLLEQFGINDSNDSKIVITRTVKTVIVGGKSVTTTTTETRTSSIDDDDDIPQLAEAGQSETIFRRNRKSSSGSTTSSSSQRSSSCPAPLDRLSRSPDISRRSTGGLSYDYTSREFPDQSPEKESGPKGDPRSGIAYYVRLDDQMNASPAERVYEIDRYGSLHSKHISEDK